MQLSETATSLIMIEVLEGREENCLVELKSLAQHSGLSNCKQPDVCRRSQAKHEGHVLGGALGLPWLMAHVSNSWVSTGELEAVFSISH